MVEWKVGGEVNGTSRYHLRAYFYLSQRSWGDYLQAEHIVDGVSRELQRGDAARTHEMTTQTREVIASHDALRRTFQEGFDELSGSVDLGFRQLDRSMSAVKASIDDLRAEFHYGLGLVVDEIQMANRTLAKIAKTLDKLYAAATTPTRTRARELYNEACGMLARGLLDKALEYYHRAEQEYDADFLTQFQIGKLYLYGKDEDDDVINLTKAEKHLLFTVRYGKAEMKQVPAVQPLVAEALLHLSVTNFVLAAEEQRADSASTGSLRRIGQARQFAAEAVQLHPQLAEAFYHHAKYCALLDDADAMTRSLREAIGLDRRYCIKIDADRDFESLRSYVTRLFQALRQEAIASAIAGLKEIVEPFCAAHDSVFASEMATAIAGAAQRLGRLQYFDALDCVGHLQKLRTIVQLAKFVTKSEEYEPFAKWQQRTKKAVLELVHHLPQDAASDQTETRFKRLESELHSLLAEYSESFAEAEQRECDAINYRNKRRASVALHRDAEVKLDPTERNAWGGAGALLGFIVGCVGAWISNMKPSGPTVGIGLLGGLAGYIAAVWIVYELHQRSNRDAMDNAVKALRWAEEYVDQVRKQNELILRHRRLLIMGNPKCPTCDGVVLFSKNRDRSFGWKCIDCQASFREKPTA